MRLILSSCLLLFNICSKSAVCAAVVEMNIHSDVKIHLQRRVKFVGALQPEGKISCVRSDLVSIKQILFCIFEYSARDA